MGTGRGAGEGYPGLNLHSLLFNGNHIEQRNTMKILQPNVSHFQLISHLYMMFVGICTIDNNFAL